MTVLEAARIGLGLAALAMLAYWTARRLGGEGDDPTLRMSASSETGSASGLLSGVYAVAAVAAVGVAAFVPELLSGGQTALIVVAFAVVVAIHWVYEKRERA